MFRRIFRTFWRQGCLWGRSAAHIWTFIALPAYDLVMHSVGGVLCTFVGYEILVCMQKRDKVKVDLPIVIFVERSVYRFLPVPHGNFSSLCSDQVAPQIGDAQHWSLALAEKAAEEHGIGLPNVIAARDPMRYALIDTMEDTGA